MAKQLVDPWTLGPDGNPDPFTRIDWESHPGDLIDPDEPISLDQHDGLAPEIVVIEGDTVRQPEPVVPPPPPPEPDGPETMELEDGTLLTIEKERGQWKGAVASPLGGSPQIYWGKTLKELIFTTLKAQANATKKIREQNVRIKRNAAPPIVPVAAPPSPSVHPLTADEIFEIKTQLDSNPDLALQAWFQKATGLSISQLVTLAQKGANADTALTIQTVGTEFLRNNPDWHACPENIEALIKWLAKYKLGKQEASDQELCEAGVWTVENLEEAFEDLSSDNKLVKAPRPTRQAPPQGEPPPPVAVLSEPALPAPRPDSRIVSQVTRPRAALGIGRSDVTPVAEPTAPKAPSAEDLESLTDEQIAQLMRGVQRARAVGRRSN